jgi:DNA-3-methyladenine glycosylase II
MAALTSVKGIGDWSAHMYLIFALRRLDVFPIGDLGLRNAMASQYKLRKSTPVSRYHKIAEAWSPYRTVGSLYLWKSYDG